MGFRSELDDIIEAQQGMLEIHSEIEDGEAMKSTQKGFSLIELLIVVAIILIIATIAIPGLLHARMRGNEASAVGSLHAIMTASQNYSSTYGTGYPSTLSALGPAVIPTASNADLLDSVLASSAKSGYTFSYSASASAGGIITSFAITADPTTRGTTGQRSFYTDQTLVIRSNTTATASAGDAPMN
jgi:type IV pilus assembly protein PilA